MEQLEKIMLQTADQDLLVAEMVKVQKKITVDNKRLVQAMQQNPELLKNILSLLLIMINFALEFCIDENGKFSFKIIKLVFSKNMQKGLSYIFQAFKAVVKIITG